METYNWQKVRIKDIGRVITGRTPPTEIEDYFGNNFPFITPSDMKGIKNIYKAERGLSSRGAALLANNTIPPKSIAVSCIGWQMGKVAMIPNIAFTNQQINTIILTSRKIDPDFVYYSLCTMRKYLQNLGSVGTRTPILKKSGFEDVEIRLPPLSIQQTIAGILSAYDDLIENNERRIAILEEMAQTLYEEWFVKFRFPGHEHVKMVESELGMIPEGWDIVKLEEVAGVNLHSIKNGNTLDEIQYVDISSVSTGQIESIQTIPFRLAPGRARRIVKHGDVIWSTVRPNRKSYSIILNPPENLIVSTGFAVISAQSVPYSYLYFALTTDSFVGYLTNHATGAAYPAVNAKEFEQALVVLPTEKTLKAFHDIGSKSLQQRETLLRKNAILRRTRDLLLPKLISGEIDVSSWIGRDERELAQELAAVGGSGAYEQGRAMHRVTEAEPVEPIEKEELEWRSLWE